MAYEVLARKWRPKHFADVIGQEHVTRTLRNAIESRRVAHAYLFVGPRGIGKTTLSRIFAKALNCSSGEDASSDPCDKCTNCTEIMAGTSLDVIEIDAASNNGVNNIRDIRDEAQFAPASSRYKVFIIDEVHMLSTGAFNALLKTLEEPPPHVKFIFATTEVDKLPATIISRCQRFDLRRIPTAMIVKALSSICEKEGVKADEDALLAIARGAEGGMRDALSALDQIISFKGNDVTEADVLAVFGLVSRKQIEDLTTAILKGDMAGGLKIIDTLDQSGKDLRRLVIEMLEHFRNLIVRQQLGDDAGTILDVTPEQLKALDNEAGLTDTARVLRIAEHFADLEGRIRYALSRRTIFETVFLRCCRAATTVTLDQLVKLVRSSGVGVRNSSEYGVQSKEFNSSAEDGVKSKEFNSSAEDGVKSKESISEHSKTVQNNDSELRTPNSELTDSSELRTPNSELTDSSELRTPNSELKEAAAEANAESFSRIETRPLPRDGEAVAPKGSAPAQPQSEVGAPPQAENSELRTPNSELQSPASTAQEIDDSPIQAAHEPAIKAVLKGLKGKITDIRPPVPAYTPPTQDDPEDLIDDTFEPVE